MRQLTFAPIFLITLLVLGLQQCSSAQRKQSAVPAFQQLESFHSLALSGGYDKVTLIQGDETLRIIGDQEDINQIEVTQENGKLGIGVKRGGRIHGSIRIEIGYKQLKSIASSGSSNINVQGTLTAETFKLAHSGSGDFKGKFDVNELELAISGSGDFDLSGRADNQDIAISGSGNVDATNLAGKSAKVGISGSGDVQLNVDGPVKSGVSGSGKVTNRS